MFFNKKKVEKKVRLRCGMCGKRFFTSKVKFTKYQQSVTESTDSTTVPKIECPHCKSIKWTIETTSEDKRISLFGKIKNILVSIFSIIQDVLVSFCAHFVFIWQKSQSNLILTWHKLFAFVGFVLAITIVVSIFKVTYIQAFIFVVVFYILLKISDR